MVPPLDTDNQEVENGLAWIASRAVGTPACHGNRWGDGEVRLAHHALEGAARIG
jgi:hypothetical protein